MRFEKKISVYREMKFESGQFLFSATTRCALYAMIYPASCALRVGLTRDREFANELNRTVLGVSRRRCAR